MEGTARAAKSEGKAIDSFIQIVGDIRVALEAIQNATDEHFDRTPDEINWAHVGDAGRVRDGLNEVLAIIRGEAK